MASKQLNEENNPVRLIDEILETSESCYKSFLERRELLREGLSGEGQEVLLNYLNNLNLEAKSYEELKHDFARIELIKSSDFSKLAGRISISARKELLKNNYSSVEEVNNRIRSLMNNSITEHYTCDCGNDSKFGKGRDSCMVCLECGLINESSDEKFESSERKAYTAEESASRKRTEVFKGSGVRTLMAGAFDGKGGYLKSGKKAHFERISKINRSSVSSYERNVIVAKHRLVKITKSLEILIPGFVEETAWKIYVEAVKQKLTRGRSIEHFCAASLYSAIRMYNIPATLEELIVQAGLDKRMLHKSLSLIVTKILPELNYTYKPVTPLTLIHRFANNMGLGKFFEKEAVQIIKTAEKIGLSSIGKDPKGYAAAALYLAGKVFDSRVTQASSSSAAGITEVTLRSRAKELRNILKKDKNSLEEIL